MRGRKELGGKSGCDGGMGMGDGGHAERCHGTQIYFGVLARIVMQSDDAGD